MDRVIRSQQHLPDAGELVLLKPLFGSAGSVQGVVGYNEVYTSSAGHLQISKLERVLERYSIEVEPTLHDRAKDSTVSGAHTAMCLGVLDYFARLELDSIVGDVHELAKHAAFNALLEAEGGESASGMLAAIMSLLPVWK